MKIDIEDYVLNIISKQKQLSMRFQDKHTIKQTLQDAIAIYNKAGK